MAGAVLEAEERSRAARSAIRLECLGVPEQSERRAARLARQSLALSAAQALGTKRERVRVRVRVARREDARAGTMPQAAPLSAAPA